jgi:hypothetical protein
MYCCCILILNMESKSLIKDVSVTQEIDIPTKDYIKAAMDEAGKFWKAVKVKSKDEKFVDLPDKEKIATFGKEFHKFQQEFPIVTRYLVCMGQFSQKAFKRYLVKIKNTKIPEKRDKSYMEDLWVRNQAHYVRYLWESYQRGHYNNTDAKAVWQGAFNALKKEFLDFRSLHDTVEKTIKDNRVSHKIERIKELMQRLASGDQTLNEEQMRELTMVMQSQLLRQRKEKNVTELLKTIKEVPVTYESFGKVSPPEEIPDNFRAQ